MKLTPVYPNVMEVLGMQKAAPNRPFRGKKERTPGAGLDIIDVFGDEDKNFETHWSFINRIKLDKERNELEEERRLEKEEMSRMSKKERMVIQEKKRLKLKKKSRKISILLNPNSVDLWWMFQSL